MTKEETAQIIKKLKEGYELSIRNAEGEWGIRSQGGQLELWEHYPYENTEPRLISEEEAHQNLAPLDFSFVLSRLH